NELKIDYDSENLCEAMELHTSGNGAVTSIYTNSVAVEDVEVTKDDLVKIEEITGANSTEHTVEIVTLLHKLEASTGKFTEEIAQLDKEKAKIDALQAEIDDLNETIVTELFPIENIQ